MTAFVALLRGVNVGGANPLAMSKLRDVFSQSGAFRVATLLRSGNVIFEAERGDGSKIAERARLSIRQQFGIDVPMVVRDAASWRSLRTHNPFLADGSDPDNLHLSCLSTAPSAAAIAGLDPNRSPPDAFVVVGANVYLKLPNGVARSKLTNLWFDKALGVVSTMRNWRTVERIAEALGAA